MNKLLQRFLNEKVAIRVRTKQEWKQFMELLEKETDVMWRYGRPTQLNFWDVLEEKTSVISNWEGGNFLGYSRYGFYEDEGYEIVECEKILEEKGEQNETKFQTTTQSD